MSFWAKRDKKWREKLSWLFITTQYTRSQEAYTSLTLTTNKIIYYKFHFWTNLINRQLQLCYLAKKLSKYCNIHIRAKPEILKLKKNFMASFSGWASTVLRLQDQYKETVYFLPLSPQKFVALTWLTSKEWKAESILEPPSGFEHKTAAPAP